MKLTSVPVAGDGGNGGSGSGRACGIIAGGKGTGGAGGAGGTVNISCKRSSLLEQLLGTDNPKN